MDRSQRSFLGSSPKFGRGLVRLGLHGPSVESVRHQFEAERGRRQFNGFDFGGADVNAVVSHVGREYALTAERLRLSNFI